MHVIFYQLVRFLAIFYVLTCLFPSLPVKKKKKGVCVFFSGRVLHIVCVKVSVCECTEWVLEPIYSETSYVMVSKLCESLYVCWSTVFARGFLATIGIYNGAKQINLN